jgi:NADH-quinone oxidoreductase subunit L
MSKLVYLVPLFPLIGFLINGLGRKALSKSTIGLIGSGVILASFAVSLGIFFEVKQPGFQTQIVRLFDFINVQAFQYSVCFPG